MRESRVFGEPVGRDTHRPEELFPEKFAGVNIEMLAHGLMVIDDFYIMGILPIPAEAYPVFIVDPDAMLTRTVTLERFEPVARREAQFVQGRGGFELSEFAEGGFVN